MKRLALVSFLIMGITALSTFGALQFVGGEEPPGGAIEQGPQPPAVKPLGISLPSDSDTIYPLPSGRSVLVPARASIYFITLEPGFVVTLSDEQRMDLESPSIEELISIEIDESKLFLNPDTLEPIKLILDPAHPEHAPIFERVIKEATK